MSRILSEKTWIALTKDEVKAVIVNFAPEGLSLGEFEIVEVRPIMRGHAVNTLVVGIKHIDGPLGVGPLRCSECGRDDFVDEDAVVEHEKACIG